VVALLDLTLPEHAYLFGFVQCDGSLYRGPGQKGKLSVETGACDAGLLIRLAEIAPVNASVRYRTRDTNLKTGHRSAVLTIYDARFRAELERLVLPSGRKSEIIAPPSSPFAVRDYLRGVIDADGSLGFARSGDPFLSFCTKSTALATAVAEFGADLTGKPKRFGANTRDRAFNVMWWREQAQAVVDVLYRDASLALPRKLELAERVLDWRRAPGRRRVPTRRNWTPAGDQVVRDFSVAEAMEILGRTQPSVAMRVRALRKMGSPPT